MLSLVLSALAAVLLHSCIRYSQGLSRACLLVAVIVLLGIAITEYPRGLWVAIYVQLSVFMLACIAMPWLDVCWRNARAD